MQDLQNACSHTGAYKKFYEEVFTLLSTKTKISLHLFEIGFRRINDLMKDTIIEEHKHTCKGSSSTPEHIGQTNSSSTSPWNLFISKPILITALHHNLRNFQ
jgi:hypothetical protein